MPFDQSIPQPLTPVAVNAHAPTASGVYGLSNSREWVYIGETDNIRGTLLSHLQELDTSIVKRHPTGFAFELCDQPSRPARQDRLVREYEPICNRHLSWCAVVSESEPRTSANRVSVRSKKMQFSFIGFSQVTGFRVFAFEGTAADRTRTEYKVKADLALVRRYGIQIQDLPLLCRGLLERNDDLNQQCTMTFTEEEMRLHARTCAEARNAAIHKRKSARKPTTGQIGSGWRAPQQW